MPATDSQNLAKTVFADELFGNNDGSSFSFRGIQNPEIRQFVLDCFALCPDYFWVRPASRAGYHPDVSTGEGGLVRHVRLACKLGEELCRAYDEQVGNNEADTKFYDEIMAALILHDVLKDGDPALDQVRGIVRERDGSQKNGFWRKTISGCHGIDMSGAIANRVLKGQITAPWQRRVLVAIAMHMGIWTRGQDGKVSNNHRLANLKDPDTHFVARLVQTADYVVSRRWDAYFTKLLSVPVPKVEQAHDSQPAMVSAA